MEVFVKKDKAQNRKKMIISFLNFYYEKKHITTIFMPVFVMKDNVHVTTKIIISCLNFYYEKTHNYQLHQHDR